MSVLRFGVFEMDPSVPELRRLGRRVHLQEMPLRTLEILLEHPGELVPRETFFARLWPHDASGILDDNLNTAVRKLRLALNDSAHHPQYVETVPRRGYRFVAPVVVEEPAAEQPAAAAAASGAESPAATPSPATPSPDGAPRRWWRRRPAAAAGVLLVTMSVGTGLLLSEAAPDAASPAPRSFEALAVLPFANAGGDPADQYFADGLADELMSTLARSGTFRVVSRTSAFALDSTGLDAREIGRVLEADALVEGSVRRDGERLRISVHLVDSSDGYQLWSQTYDRRRSDVFTVQEDIARTIANTLAGRLLEDAESSALAVPVTDPVAYDHYLEGRFYWHRRTEPDLRKAAVHFQKAVELAPAYAPAWIGLADAHAVLGFYDYQPPDEAFPQAQRAARRALELEPASAAARATLGYAALYYDWDLAGAEVWFREAIHLRPDYSKAHQWYANLLTAAGRFEEAEAAMRRAQQLDPLSLIASAALGWARYHAGRHEQALEQLRLTLALDPQFELAYLWSGWALEALGRYDEAFDMLSRVAAQSGSGISRASLARLQALRGRQAQARELLNELVHGGGYLPSYEIAKAYLALGDADEADAWLARAVEQRSHSLVFLQVDPQLSDYRDTAAFRQLADLVRPNVAAR